MSNKNSRDIILHYSDDFKVRVVRAVTAAKIASPVAVCANKK